MKIDGLTEAMFAQAVALAQNGKMKSTIHAGGSDIFIANMDQTILLHYKAPQDFDAPFSFFANDYESPRIRIEDGKVVFITNVNGIRRTKVCAPPKGSFEDKAAVWAKHAADRAHSFTVTKDMVGLLDEGLSHIEISKTEDGPLVLLQRDIYSGARIEVEHNKSGSIIDLSEGGYAFGPLGVRTVDFQALFTFSDSLTFYPQEGKAWMFFEDFQGNFAGVLSTCLYDELGYISKDEG